MKHVASLRAHSWLTWTADPAEITAWVERAAPGDRFTYAQGDALPVGHGAAIVARRLHEEGLVGLSLQRQHGRLSYILRRVRQRMDARPEAAPLRLSGHDARMYRVLSDCAERGDPCPDNGALMRLTGLRSPSQASYQIHRLIQHGKIARSFTDEGVRVIRILSTGKATAERVS